jgi:hypothetical protein
LEEGMGFKGFLKKRGFQGFLGEGMGFQGF